ncbi:unnamed protein product [Moneuplotes crassus]|uniref:Uncharacterized protein n=1 Tax=Euplotes crassus TaxID=5936 RepID=A0AAD1ULM7_EUPCR|nr:unnamed protein product [Moneuplotes crassus]
MGNRVAERVRDWDLLAVPIGFSVAKRRWGSGLVTVVVTCGVLGVLVAWVVVMVVQGEQMKGRSEVETTTTTGKCRVLSPKDPRMLLASSIPYDSSALKSLTTDFTASEVSSTKEWEEINSATLAEEIEYPFSNGFALAICQNKPINNEFGSWYGFKIVPDSLSSASLISCTTDLFPEEVREELSKVDLSSCLCVENPESIPIRGCLCNPDFRTFGLAYFSTNCTNNCDAREEYFNGITFTMYYTSGYYNPSSTPPHGFKLEEQTYYSSLDKTIDSYLNLRETQITSSSGSTQDSFYTGYSININSGSSIGGIPLLIQVLRDSITNKIQTTTKTAWTPVTDGRNLDSQSTSTTQVKIETKKMMFYYNVLYVMANIGGLLAILWLIITLLIKPITNKMQTLGLINNFNNDREYLIDSYKSIEQCRMEELAQFKNSLIQKENRQAMLRMNGCEEEDEKVQELNGVVQHNSGDQMKPIESQFDSSKYPKSKSLKKRSTAKVYAVQEESIDSSSREFQSNKDLFLSQKKNESAYYTTWDMLRATLYCCRSKTSNSLNSKDISLLQDLDFLNSERDIKTFLSKLTTLEKRNAVLSELLEARIIKKKH